MARKHRDAMRLLVAEIVSGGRAAGEMLPKQVDLATEFEVSRGVARETIRALEERGLISVRHGEGATVNEPGQWDVFDPDVLATTLESGHGGARLLCMETSGVGDRAWILSHAAHPIRGLTRRCTWRSAAFTTSEAGHLAGDSASDPSRSITQSLSGP
jgi:DNA-binding transcriptional MocR family regulator